MGADAGVRLLSPPLRLPDGGDIDRTRTWHFEFDGRRYHGHPGDTLASALLAAGVRLFGRSVKYHRPRGVLAWGADEPNALVTVGSGPAAQPNLRATEVPLHDGLVARSQNRWPSLRWDAAALLGLLAPLLPAGFYYKTFMWPRGGWHLYERVIRRAAGLGRAPTAADPDRYVHAHAEVDVLVAGGGPAGLAAAKSAAAAGLSVLLADDGASLGGFGRVDAQAWVRRSVERLAAQPGVTLLSRATVAVRHDHGEHIVLQQLDGGDRGDGAAAQRRWTVQARQLVLATGAAERPLVFADNDRPGVMLASAVRQLLRLQAVRPGRRAVVFANHDGGFEAALDLEAAGTEVVAVVDLRADAVLPPALRCRTLLAGHAVVRARGRLAVRACEVMALSADGRGLSGPRRRLDCDLIVVAGGWTPRIHLSCHLGGRPRYDEALDAFLPVAAPDLQIAGACGGHYTPQQAIASGHAAGAAAATALGHGETPFGEATPGATPALPAPAPPAAMRAAAARPVPRPPGRSGPRFVDLQSDVTVADLALACREGLVAIEHVKRYTALGMGTDQGRTSNMLGLSQVAALTGRPIAAVGTTTFRPPYTPMTLGAIAGRRLGARAAPARVSPLHDGHVAAGAHFMQAGAWLRAQFFARPGESDDDTVLREARQVRAAVGITDVSSLGKIELHGPDVAALLDRVYVNGWRTLAVGRSRYGVMLRPDGAVLDDGTVSRLGEQHFLMTTTTGNAERVYAHLERALQIEWPGLDVRLELVSDQWGAMAIAGPLARELLRRLEPSFAIEDADFPYLSVRGGRLGAWPVRVCRISFAGELGYEVYAPADLLPGLWAQALARGAALDVMPYGTEAMMVLRIEKGFFVPGFEADGRTTPHDLGLSRMLSTSKAFVGQAALACEAFAAADRLQLVGVVCEDPAAAMPRGAQLQAERPAAPGAVDGHLTSMAFSPVLERWVALALLKGGQRRHGERLIAASPLAGQRTPVTVVAPVFVDPEGARLHA